MPWNTFNRSEQAVTEVGIFLLPTMPMRSHEIEICLFLPPPFPTQKEFTIPWGNRLTTCTSLSYRDQE